MVAESDSATRDLCDFVNRRRLTWKHLKLFTTTPSVVAYLAFFRCLPGRRSLLSGGVREAGGGWGGARELEGVVGASGWMGDKRAGTGATGLGMLSALPLAANLSRWLKSTAH